MAQLRSRISDIRAMGAELYAVGNGKVEHLRWFLDDMKPIDFPAWTDPTREVFRVAGLKHGLLRTVGPKAAARYALGVMRGFANKGGVLGDPYQQGGALVVHPDGRIAYRHVSEEVAHHADVDAILAALRR